MRTTRACRAAVLWTLALAVLNVADPAAGQGIIITNPGSTGTDWTQFRFDPAGTGFNPYETVLSPETVGDLTEAWTVPLPAYVSSAPAVVGGILYVGIGPEPLTSASYLYAIDAITGQSLWRRKQPYATFASDPTVAHGLVYVGTLNDHRLRSYDAITGQDRWSFLAAGAISDPVVVGNTLYVAANSGLVYALNARTGHLLWTSPVVGPLQGLSVAVAGGTVFAGSQDNHLYAFDRRDGDVLWAAPTGGDIFSSPAISRGRVFVGSVDGSLYAFDAASGAQVWSEPTGSNVDSSPAVAYGYVYVGSADGLVYAFDQRTGALGWTVRTGAAIAFASPVVANGVVYVGSKDGAMYAIDAVTGKLLWTYATADLINDAAAVRDGVLYFGSFDMNFYAFSLA